MYIGIATNIFNDFLLSLVGIATGADANKLEHVYWKQARQLSILTSCITFDQPLWKNRHS